ncbi:MAG: hypothetical protein EHM58_09710 [Ignavibacteriae bacterium]|nr:MAG: hypothetical protein EHM58_09710 [Ignavibacteriota bacterium]
MYFIKLHIDRINSLKFVAKFIWVLHNFLRMECYRKLCNKLYWKKLEPGTLPYTTRFWVIGISVLSAVWLAFFFDPIDPANSNSTSAIMNRISKIFRKTEVTFYSLASVFGKVYNHIKILIFRNFGFIDNIFLRQSQETYLKTSSIRI